MQRPAEFSLRHRRAVLVICIAVALAGAWAASGLSDALSRSVDAPGRPAFEANAQTLQQFGNGGALPPIAVVFESDEENGLADAESRAEIEDALARVAKAVPGSRIASQLNAGAAPFVSADGRTALALVLPPPGPRSAEENPAALAAVQGVAKHLTVAGQPVRVSGVEALTGHSGGGGLGLFLEILVGAAGALIILIWVFGSRLALLPLLVAAVSILATFLVLRGLAALIEISFVVQFLVGLIGLGVAIDYSLLIVFRWREERGRQESEAAAIVAAMRTAGHSVLVSGTTVAIGLLALIVVPVPFIRSIGIGGLLIPAISVLVCATMLPALLAVLGPRFERAKGPVTTDPGHGWMRWTRWVVAHRLPVAISGLIVLVALGVVALGLHPGQPTVDALSSEGEARTALTALERAGLGGGALTPIEVTAARGADRRVAEQVAAVPGIRAVAVPSGADWGAEGRRALLALPLEDAASDSGGTALDGVRDLEGELPGNAQVGGAAAQDRDLTEAIYGSLPAMAALIGVITFLLLARALRSLVLPLKAIALNVLSIGASFGIVVLVWQEGHGSELIGGVPGTGAITNWVPLAMFAFLYGLSMDYEVFILSRIREEYDARGSTEEAVVRGLGRTGRLVTSAALILCFAFVALAAGPGTEIKILATGLAAGILLDATLVRAMIVPALVVLFGKANWWWPTRLGGPSARSTSSISAARKGD